jgi:2-polyprenyl-3-methyl-5-hydroxy-6-metoxy-1,4-benzoquinol methylase
MQSTTPAQALSFRLFQATLGFLDLISIYLGDRLGLYAALVAAGPSTSLELAARTKTDERYVREWLEQQAVTGLLDVDQLEAAPEARRYRLAEDHEEVLLDQTSLNYMGGVARLAVGAIGPLPNLLEAYRTGAGILYSDYGPDTRDGIAALNRPQFVNLLGGEWLPSIPEVHVRLQSDPPARVADVGCGIGWSSLAIASAYAKVSVDGFDLDAASIAAATANAQAAGLGERVKFQVRNAADPDLAGRYDLVTAFETVHDMARPVDALRAMRGMLAENGVVLIVDERVAETFGAPGDDLERFNYGWSIVHCLPSSRAESPSAATGTVMRPATFFSYALEAGFSNVEVLPIDNDSWRFYRLVR